MDYIDKRCSAFEERLERLEKERKEQEEQRNVDRKEQEEQRNMDRKEREEQREIDRKRFSAIEERLEKDRDKQDERMRERFHEDSGLRFVWVWLCQHKGGNQSIIMKIKME